MTEYILSSIICHEFEKVVGKCQVSKQGTKMMHIGFDLNPNGNDQYEVQHMYIYAPGNYVYVAVQQERIDETGKRIVGDMKILSYHDSCWRDEIQSFIFKNRKELAVLKSFGSIFDWYDILDITEEEAEYLYRLNSSRHDYNNRDKKLDVPNPFDKRGI